MFIYLNKKAQSTAEYVIVLGLIIGAVIAMQNYVKRGFQGRMKNAIDYVDNSNQNTGVVTFDGKQFEPKYLTSNFNTDSEQNETEGLETGGSLTKKTDRQWQLRTGSQTIEGEAAK